MDFNRGVNLEEGCFEESGLEGSREVKGAPLGVVREGGCCLGRSEVAGLRATR